MKSCRLSPWHLWRAPTGRATLALVKASVGDIIVVEAERVDRSALRGQIEEVLREDPPRYQVHWEDGRTSIFSPAAGVARIEQPKRRKASSRPRG
jgi:hypothetical protein